MDFQSIREHLEKVHVFSVVARMGSFRKAATVLRIAQPSLSRAVRILEETLERPLFTRTRQGVFLTPTGNLLLEFNDKMKSELEKVEHRIRHSRTRHSARLLVGSYESLAIRIWPRLLKKVGSKYPEISVSLKTNCDNALFQRMLLSSQLDLTVTVSPAFHPELAQRKLYVETMALYTSRKKGPRRFQSGGPIGMNELKQQPLILVPTAQFGEGVTLEQVAMQLGIIQGQLTYELDSFEAAKEFVSEGVGVSLLPRWVALQAVKLGLITELRVQGVTRGPIASHAVVACYRKADEQNPSIQAVLKETEALFGGPFHS